jgi:signal peptidase I
VADLAVSDPGPDDGEPGRGGRLRPASAGGGTAVSSPRRSGRGSRTLIEWLLIIGVTIVVTLVVKALLFQAFFIPSGSMEPTLKPGDRVLVAKTAYTIHRGDIIVFKKPPTDNADISDLIKRVIGLPGDTISARGGYVYIDGRKLAEPWLPKVDQGVTSAFGPEKVPSGDYFVMGDNRTNSDDSRFIGPIPKSLVVGKMFLRIWPLSSIKLF